MSKFIQILQDWNLWQNKKINTGIKRNYYLNQLSEFAGLEEIIGLCGVRRCGKSTLLLQLIKELHDKNQVPFENTLYVNFEDPRLGNDLKALNLFTLLQEYRQELKPRGKIYLFLDEIQAVQDWEKIVRTIYDQKQNVKIFVSGSSSSIFDSSLSTLLSGRLITLQIYPLNFAEFLEFKQKQGKNISLKNKRKINEELNEYLTYGGFPKIVLATDNITKRSMLISYYESILEQDVILKHNIRQKTILKQLAKFVLSNVGNQISTYALQKTLGIGNQHISRYLDYLADAYLIYPIQKFAYSVKKQIYNPSKIFCVDLGLVNTAGFSFSENKGHLLENLVFLKLRQTHQDLFYWSNGTEVDFLVRRGVKVDQLVNVTQTVDDADVWQRELNSLNIAGEQYPQAKTKLITLYNESKHKKNNLILLTDYLLQQR